MFESAPARSARWERIAPAPREGGASGKRLARDMSQGSFVLAAALIRSNAAGAARAITRRATA